MNLRQRRGCNCESCFTQRQVTLSVKLQHTHACTHVRGQCPCTASCARTAAHHGAATAQADAAKALVAEMRGLGIEPDVQTYAPLIGALGRAGMLAEALQVRNSLVTGRCDNASLPSVWTFISPPRLYDMVVGKYGIFGIIALAKNRIHRTAGRGAWRVQASRDSKDDALIVLTNLVNRSKDASSKSWLEAAFARIILVHKVSQDDHSVVPPV
jgi:pentatricopeptide repeat protein